MIWLLGIAAVGLFVAYRGFYQVQADQVGIELLFGAAKQDENTPGCTITSGRSKPSRPLRSSSSMSRISVPVPGAVRLPKV